MLTYVRSAIIKELYPSALFQTSIVRSTSPRPPHVAHNIHTSAPCTLMSGVAVMEGGGLDPEPSRGSSSDSLEPESDGRVPDSDGYAPAGPVTIVWIYTQQTWSKTKKRSGTTYTGHGTTTVHTCTY